MASRKVGVDKQQCAKIAAILKGLKFRKSYYQREFLSFQADRETKLRAYLFAAAICHQTHGLRKSGFVGWDCIEHVFLDLAKTKSRLLDPFYLSSILPDELSLKLKQIFLEGGKCTLVKLEERAEFMIEISKILMSKHDGMVSNMIDRSGGLLLSKGHGIYDDLGGMEAFSDPARKKGTLFVKLAMDAQLFKVKDPENLNPIMDYHIQRMLLRTGCVEVIDEPLKRSLMNREKLRSDEDVRSACVEASRMLSEVSGYAIPAMNDFFWPLGRSCCRETTLCHDRKCVKNPCTFSVMVDIKIHEKCVLECVCKGSLNEEYRKLWQPEVDTHYY